MRHTKPAPPPPGPPLLPPHPLPPAPPPVGRAFVVTVCRPPDWTDADMTASLAELVGRFQQAAGLYRSGWERAPAVTARPLDPAPAAAG